MANRRPHKTASLKYIKKNLREEFDIWCEENPNRKQPGDRTVFFDDVIEFLAQRQLILKGERWLTWIDCLPRGEFTMENRWEQLFVEEPLVEGYIPPRTRFGG